jgi:hypothetical protein
MFSTKHGDYTFAAAVFAQPQIFASLLYPYIADVRDLKCGAWIIHYVITFELNLIKFALLVHMLLRRKTLCHASDKTKTRCQD